MTVKLFADGADAREMKALADRSTIAGLTTNPTLMRKAGVTDYAAFAKDVLSVVTEKPVSFEVFADDFPGMERQARLIASWGENVYVKIPVTNTKGEDAAPLMRRLARAGVKVNATAILTIDQVRRVSEAVGDAPAFVSVFAGRIADTGRDPVPVMAEAVKVLSQYPKQELIWASPREVLNLYQAEAVGCHVITMTPDLIKKMGLRGKDLDVYSLETVRMFHEDAKGLTL